MALFVISVCAPPSKVDDIAAGLGEFDADLVDIARVLGGVALADDLLQGAVGLRFAFDYFDDVIASAIDAATAAAIRRNRKSHINHQRRPSKMSFLR